jgi:phosphate transport system substrate-binding protein
MKLDSKRYMMLAALATLVGAGAAFSAPMLVTGAGATFPAPLYSKWFSDYNHKAPDVQINYQAIGSGGGIKQITEKTVDFGATDAPMSDAEMAKAPGVIHIPTVLGAVVITYNEPDLKDLKLTPETLSAIFLGKITMWNDAAIAKDNPGKLPSTPITVAHRSDGSGTTAVFTDYLSKVSPDWKTQVGVGKSPNWPAGLGGKGNDGVTGLVKNTKGAIGYVELAYANQNKLPIAALRNADGKFVKPSLETTSAAAAGVEVPADYRVSITNAPGAQAWPISAFTYILVHQDNADAAKGKAIAEFLWWATHDGQTLAAPLDYAPLPKSVVAKVDKTLQSLTVAGKPALVNAR